MCSNICRMIVTDRNVVAVIELERDLVNFAILCDQRTAVALSEAAVSEWAHVSEHVVTRVIRRVESNRHLIRVPHGVGHGIYSSSRTRSFRLMERRHTFAFRTCSNNAKDTHIHNDDWDNDCCNHDDTSAATAAVAPGVII